MEDRARSALTIHRMECLNLRYIMIANQLIQAEIISQDQHDDIKENHKFNEDRMDAVITILFKSKTVGGFEAFLKGVELSNIKLAEILKKDAISISNTIESVAVATAHQIMPTQTEVNPVTEGATLEAEISATSPAPPASNISEVGASPLKLKTTDVGSPTTDLNKNESKTDSSFAENSVNVESSILAAPMRKSLIAMNGDVLELIGLAGTPSSSRRVETSFVATSPSMITPTRTNSSPKPRLKTFQDANTKQNKAAKVEFTFTTHPASLSMGYLPSDVKLTYEGCVERMNRGSGMCRKKVTPDGSMYKCGLLHRNEKCILIGRFNGNFSDHTGKFRITLWDKDVENLFGKCILELHKIPSDSVEAISLLQEATTRALIFKVTSTPPKNSYGWENVGEVIVPETPRKTRNKATPRDPPVIKKFRI